MPFDAHATLADALLSPLVDACRVIMHTRDNGLVVDRKSDDSPVTEADRRAEAILSAALQCILPDVPIVAEESAAEGRTPSFKDTFILLDPLDGTRDYAAGRSDFTVNIGVVDQGRPVFGLIYAPARSELFVTRSAGAAVEAALDWRNPPCALGDLALKPLRVAAGKSGHLRAIVSRRECGPDFDDRLAHLGVSTRTAASSAVKFGLIARGDADVYPRFGPTCEWDTAAGEAIVEAAGGSVTALDGTPLVYGKVAAKFLNGPFIARGRTAGSQG
jgi:3'(2'), 5'-bisphosphate nucleotidase